MNFMNRSFSRSAASKRCKGSGQRSPIDAESIRHRSKQGCEPLQTFLEPLILSKTAPPITFYLLSYLGEMEKAIALYKRNVPKEAGKIPIRPLLQLLKACDNPLLWSREYDLAASKGTDFGKDYARLREQIGNTGAFPNNAPKMAD